MNVTVEREQDYPPTANAGYNQLIRLPKKEVFIYGNQSTDDKVLFVYICKTCTHFRVDGYVMKF